MKSGIRKNIITSIMVFVIIVFPVTVYGCTGKKELPDEPVSMVVFDSLETSEEIQDVKTEIPSAFEETEDESEIKETVEIPVSAYAGDPDSQPELIDDWYDVLTDYVNKELSGPFFHRIAITDLNHNGRLEILISSVQGSGLYSDTAMFEVDETYSSLIQLKPGGYSDLEWDDDIDRNGDFVMYDELCCYKKDDCYYYPVENFGSGGWDSKWDILSNYSFDGGINNSQIVKYILSANSSEDKLIHVHLYDSNDELITDEANYREKLNSYWNDYEKFSTVSLKWVVYPAEKENSLAAIKESYAGYSEKPFHETDYFQDFRSVYGDEFEFQIETEDIKRD